MAGVGGGRKLRDLPDGEGVFPHGEAHIKPGKGHAVDALRVLMVGRTRIQCQYTAQGFPAPGGDLFQQFRRELHL